MPSRTDMARLCIRDRALLPDMPPADDPRVVALLHEHRAAGSWHLLRREHDAIVKRLRATATRRRHDPSARR